MLIPSMIRRSSSASFRSTPRSSPCGVPACDRPLECADQKVCYLMAYLFCPSSRPFQLATWQGISPVQFRQLRPRLWIALKVRNFFLTFFASTLRLTLCLFRFLPQRLNNSFNELGIDTPPLSQRHTYTPNTVRNGDKSNGCCSRLSTMAVTFSGCMLAGSFIMLRHASIPAMRQK